MESNYSNQVQTLSSDVLAPAQVVNLSFTVSQGAVSLSWDPVKTNSDGSDVTDLAGYRVYRKNTAEETYTSLVGTTDAPTTTFEDTAEMDLKDGATFFYAVAAIDDEASENEGELSVDLQVKTIPSVPKNLVAETGDGFVDLTWDSVKDELDTKVNENLNGYRIYRSEIAGQYTDIPLATVESDTTTYHDDTITNDKTYYYVVTSIDNSK